MSERLTRVREELEQRADAGATLLELETVLDGHRKNPRLTADEYDERCEEEPQGRESRLGG